MDDKKPKPRPIAEEAVDNRLGTASADASNDKLTAEAAQRGAAPAALQVCRLCQRRRVLRLSHFIPAAFYYHLGLDETGTFHNKALQKLTRSRFARVPGQTKKHLLCDECEQRFSVNGEAWVGRFAHQVGRGFGLQEALLRIEPRMTLSSGRIYYADDDPEIAWSKLAYFALSIFWRGAGDPWTKADEQVAKPFIEIEAALQERLRRFLLGEEGYPAGVLVLLKLSSSLSPAAHMISFPSKGTIETPDGPRPQYSFIVPGMIFTLVPGPDVPEEWVRQGCLIGGPGHPIFMLDTDELFFRESLTLAVTAKPSKKIIDEARALWREALERQ